MPANNIENALVNGNNEERSRDDLLDRMDYQLDNENDDPLMGSNHENPLNIPDDARPDAFDENSRGNFDLPILGESSGCNLNLEIGESNVNDDSSRESLDMDYENEKPTLGNITVERNPEKIDCMAHASKNRNDLDEEANFYENDEYCSYLENGETNELNSCKCRKCTLKDRSHADSCGSGNCCEDDLNVCYKRRELCSSNEDEERFDDSKNLVAHGSGINNKEIINENESFEQNPNLNVKMPEFNDDNEMDTEDREPDETNQSKCTCFEDKLDHVNGHSSKMCLELSKMPCEKCSTKNVATSTSSSSLASSSSAVNSFAKNQAQAEDVLVIGDAEANNNNDNNNIADADAENVENLNQENASNNRIQNHRNRDNNNIDLDNVRPNKRAKLNNGLSSSRNKAPRTIFHRALDAVNMSWDNQHLKNILASAGYSINSSNAVQTAGSSKPSQTILTTVKANFNVGGQPLWHESLSMCSARIDSLRSHGHTEAALRLSVSVVRTMKQVQKDAQMIWKRCQTTANSYHSRNENSNSCCCDCSNKSNTKTISSSYSSDGKSISTETSNSQNPDGSTSNINNTNKQNINNNSNHHSNMKNMNGNSSGAGSSSNSNGNRKRSYDTRNNSNICYSSSMSSNRNGYKMYRFDYGNYHSSYRYGMNNDGCKRCLEARERAGYQNSFNNNYHSNRFNMNGNVGMQPPYFRNNFGPVRCNMYDQRFNSNHFGSNNYRYNNNNGYPPNNMQNNRPCHSENCNIGHHRNAQQNNHHAHVPPNDGISFGNGMYNGSRQRCNRDSIDNVPHMNSNSHRNYNNSDGNVQRCSHDMINAPIQQKQTSNESTSHSNTQNNSNNNNNNCRNCNSQKENDEPCSSSMATNKNGNCSASTSASTSSNSNSNPKSNANGNSNSNSTASTSNINNNDNQMKNSFRKACDDASHQQNFCFHDRNQCCVRNYCCNSSNDRPKCCQNDMHQNACHCSTMSQHHMNAEANFSRCSSNNIYFGRNISFDIPQPSDRFIRCNPKPQQDEHFCKCYPMIQQSHDPALNSHSCQPTPSTSSNYAGASTSKSFSNNNNSSSMIQSNEFSRNKKANCSSNCIDCTVGCDIEFPLDAVACIFDCLTEACIIPDAMNGPDMGRLSFDSVTSAAEDGSLIPPRYQHVNVPHSNDPNETFLTLAFEAAVLALGKQRNMPPGLYSQHVICKQQDQLIQRLRHVELDRLLIGVLKQLTSQLLDGGPTSGLGVSIHPESIPMHTLARFLFASLLTHYDDLAFYVGLRAMRLPILEECPNEMHMENNLDLAAPHNIQRDGFVSSRFPR